MTDPFSTSLQAARHHLSEAKRLLGVEISTYPTPISGCDAQFNHLLAERTRVSSALSALEQSVFIPTPRTPNQGDRVESR